MWYNWSVWEHEKAHEEDRFFMVRVGEGKTGVVMSGYFLPNHTKMKTGQDFRLIHAVMQVTRYYFYQDKTAFRVPSL